MNVLNQKVSMFSSYRDADPKEVILFDFLTSKEYVDEVNEIRKVEDKKVKDELKSKLPAITPSGLFDKRRSASNLIKHTGIIQVDIDKQDNEHLKMQEVKKLLEDIEQVSFASYSVSGNGLFALIQIKYPEKHKEHFLSLEYDFKNDFNIVIDKSCKDVSRLRGYSYDEAYYFNEDALIYNQLFQVTKTIKPKVKKLITEPITERHDFHKALRIIEQYNLDITGNNEQWFEILCSIANEYGETGRGFAHFVSQYSSLYDNDRCDKDYNRALKSNYRYNIGTFYHYLKLQYIA